MFPPPISLNLVNKMFVLQPKNKVSKLMYR